MISNQSTFAHASVDGHSSVDHTPAQNYATREVAIPAEKLSLMKSLVPVVDRFYTLPSPVERARPLANMTVSVRSHAITRRRLIHAMAMMSRAPSARSSCQRRVSVGRRYSGVSPVGWLNHAVGLSAATF